MTKAQEFLLEKLYNAYRLERRALRILQVAQEIARLCPRVRTRVRDHVTETRWQTRLLEVCIENMGGDPSEIPSGAYLPFARSSAAFKRQEIEAYHALILAAEAANEPEVVQVGREILAQELAMSTWLESYRQPGASSLPA